MHQTPWSPERPLPPPVSLASQSHHEKPPEVTCTSRGNPGFPAWGFLPDDARASHCPFVLTSFTGWSSERCPGIGFLSRGDWEIGVLRNVEAPTRPLVYTASSTPGPPGSWSALPSPPQVHPDPGLRCSQSGGEEVSGEPCLQPHVEQMWEEGGCSIQLRLNCAQTAWDAGRGSEPVNPGRGATLADANFSGFFTAGLCLKVMSQRLPLQELVQTTHHREGHQLAPQLRPHAHVAAAPT